MGGNRIFKVTAVGIAKGQEGYLGEGEYLDMSEIQCVTGQSDKKVWDKITGGLSVDSN